MVGEAENKFTVKVRYYHNTHLINIKSFMLKSYLIRSFKMIRIRFENRSKFSAHEWTTVLWWSRSGRKDAQIADLSAWILSCDYS